MLDRLKKQGLKIFIFVINILLLVIAVLAIRHKDQERLLKQAEQEENSSDTSLEGQMEQTSEAVPLPQEETTPDPNLPAQQPVVAPAVPVPVSPPAPSKIQPSKPSSSPDRKTKTS
jgi:hypothetical protein